MIRIPNNAMLHCKVGQLNTERKENHQNCSLVFTSQEGTIYFNNITKNSKKPHKSLYLRTEKSKTELLSSRIFN